MKLRRNLLEAECVKSFNRLVLSGRLFLPRIQSISSLDSSSFLQLLKGLNGHCSLIPCKTLHQNEETKFRLILQRLSSLLDIGLDHLNPKDLANKKPTAICNLLEIFTALYRLKTRKRDEILNGHSDVSTDSSTSLVASFSSSTSLVSFSSSLSSLSSESSCQQREEDCKHSEINMSKQKTTKSSGSKIVKKRAASPKKSASSKGLAPNIKTHQFQDKLESIIRHCILPGMDQEAAEKSALELSLRLQRAIQLEDMVACVERKIALIRGELQPHWNCKSFDAKPPTRTLVKSKSLKGKRLLTSKVKSLEPKKDNHVALGDVHSANFEQSHVKIPLSNPPLVKLAPKVSCSHIQNDTYRMKKLEEIRKRAVTREARCQRAILYKSVEDFERNACSKYLAIESKLHQTIKNLSEQNKLQKIEELKGETKVRKVVIQSKSDLINSATHLSRIMELKWELKRSSKPWNFASKDPSNVSNFTKLSCKVNPAKKVTPKAGSARDSDPVRLKPNSAM